MTISENLCDNITFVERVADRLMALEINIGNKVMGVFVAYVPQAGCINAGKEKFWMELSDGVRPVPKHESLQQTWMTMLVKSVTMCVIAIAGMEPRALKESKPSLHSMY